MVHKATDVANSYPKRGLTLLQLTLGSIFSIESKHTSSLRRRKVMKREGEEVEEEKRKSNWQAFRTHCRAISRILSNSK
uniref:Uncharacterized protein n=1 Tax=Vespula pensylvanica TaxID=30213 RepID=A0A834UHM8_VESPE|nr:hypothetical protein H0235_001669 [Vespula pensylvanica]